MPSTFKTLISADSHVMEPRDLWDKTCLFYTSPSPRD